jgi:glycosyl-4,4'-diaponeurosporenoate acyltransferase
VDASALLLRVLVDIAVVVGWSALVGATAPRWPDPWLQHDRGPLRLTAWDTPQRHRRLRVAHLVRTLPEGGAWFGGTSKARLPGTDPASLGDYLLEVRRGEWVHWLSMLSVVPVLLIGPWWLGLAFAGVVVVVNGGFVLVLRHNRMRLLAVLRRAAARQPVDDPGSLPEPPTDPANG